MSVVGRGGCITLMRMAVLTILIVTRGVAAQTSRAPHTPEYHGWIAGVSVEGTGGTLIHLPPRAGVGDTPGAEAGDAWNARMLEAVPRAVASWDQRVFLLYRRDEQWLDIFSIDVSRALHAGVWLTEPSTGADARRSLDLEGAAYAGAVGSARGLLVLGEQDSGEWSLWRLAGREWEAVELTPAIASAERVWLVEGADPPQLVAMTGSVLVAWTWDSADRPPARAWTGTNLTMPDGVRPEDVAAVFASGGDIVWVVFTPGSDELRVESVGPNLVGTIATVRLDGTPFDYTPLDSGKRLVVASETVNPSAEGLAEPIREWRLIELSMVTGRELYRGPPAYPTLAFGDSVRFLSLGMMALSGFVLFYLLRPVPTTGEIAVPAGWVLATPGRRVFAGLLDAWLVVGVVGVSLDVRPSDFVLVLPLFESARGVVALGTAIIGGTLYGTASEWMLGRTLGKAAAGLRVVSVDPARPTVGLLRCGARNVFRWALAPWALLGMGSGDFRHRGDVVAVAAVVTRRDEAATSEDGPGRN